MKKSIKLLSLSLIIVILASLFVSCTADEMTLLNALCKSTDITSMESKTELSLSMEATGLSKQDQESFQQVAAMLNNSKIMINQKTKSSADKSSTKAQVDVSVDIGGMAVASSVWVDSDLTGTKPKMTEIIKIPAILTMSMPAEFQGKQYMIFDIADLASATSATSATSVSSFDYKQLLESSKNITPKVVAFIKDYFTNFNPGFSAITKKDDKIVDGQTLSVYKLKLDDAAFKALIDYGVTDFIQNEKTLSLTKDFILSIINLTSITAKEKTSAEQEINKAFEQLKTGIPEFKEQWKNAMTVLKDVKLLGEKGIDIDFGINSDGYVVSEDGIIDLLIDIKAIENAGESFSLLQDSKYKKQLSTQTGILQIGLGFHSINTNINKEVSINIPALTPKNSFTYMDMMKSLIPPEPPKDMTPPAPPVVNKVLHTAKIITGKAEIGSTIVVKNSKIIVGTGIVNSKGVYSIKIKPQRAKSVLLITAMDKSGNKSKATTAIVK